jgi:NADH-dependent peroxiredoxin subunit F
MTIGKKTNPSKLPSKNQDFPKIFDTIIIGAGPAGMTAAIYAARRKMKALLITGKTGGQMRSSSDIENWTGVAQATGPELTKMFFHHVKKVDDDNAHFDLWVREGELVKTVGGDAETGFWVETDGGFRGKSKTLICTTGKVPKTLGVKGESIAQAGRGLSFCATCDAPLYKDKKMVVIGGGNSAMDVALQLEKFTDDITIFAYESSLQGETVMIEKCQKSPHINIEYGIKTQEILLDGKQKVRGIAYQQKGVNKEIFCEGIFEEIGQTPATSFLSDLVTLNTQGEIPVNRNMNTKTPGIFAGGDCTDGDHKQVVVAAGEGAIAALEAHEFLLRQR